MSRNGKIFPRNLTARAAHRIAGNPDISRPEDTVANCFPGLDMDLRNLDRRFFPGLVFEFISGLTDDDPWQGARLLYCDALADPELQPAFLDQLDQIPDGYENERRSIGELARARSVAPQAVGTSPPQQPLPPRVLADLRDAIRQRQQELLAELTADKFFKDVNKGVADLRLTQDKKKLDKQRKKGIWFLESVTQGTTTITFSTTTAGKTVFQDGVLVVWRLIRSLRPGAVDIVLRKRCASSPKGKFVTLGKNKTLYGWRRWFTNPLTGVLSGAYQPGELTMSMCSPWQHDFRDCACHYWASNRPDVVYGQPADSEPLLPGGEDSDPVRATTRLDWMRADRSAQAAALSTMFANRPFQMDHFQISQTWESLNVVLRNTEIGEVYAPPLDVSGDILNDRELYETLQKLAGLEMTLALEYLYASFSLIGPADNVPGDWPDARMHAEMARHALRLTAVSEMQHLRWVNELLWSLQPICRSDGIYEPILEPASTVPVSDSTGAPRSRALRALTPDVLDEFIAIERPSSGAMRATHGIDGAYTRVVATLAAGGYPAHLHELASRIATDGTEHFARFDNLRVQLEAYNGCTNLPYLRTGFALGSLGDPQVKAASACYKLLKTQLAAGYSYLAERKDAAAAAEIAQARGQMTELLNQGNVLAARGLGIPFW